MKHRFGFFSVYYLYTRIEPEVNPVKSDQFKDEPAGMLK